ncbi:MAG: hypothetical protein IJ433_06245 [Ruminococcus sp.]|nr:hypothetical protein [Ruminococcus sp.]
MESDNRLSHINNGAIDFYIALKIECKVNYNKLCEIIQNKIDNYTKAYNNSMYNRLETTLQTAISGTEFEDYLKIKENFATPKKSLIIEDSQYKEELCGFKIDNDNNKVGITPISRLEKYYSETYEEIKANHKTSLQIYGSSYINCQRRFMLPPIELNFTNGAVDLLTAVLTIFTNNTAILRLTLPLNNVAATSLMANEIDSYISNAKTLPGFPVALEDKNINSIEKCYYKFLFSSKKIKSIRKYSTITNIILANYSTGFDDIKKIPDETKEDIYKISIAPIPDRDGLSYREDALSYFSTNGTFINGVGYLIGSIGRCVSIVDNTTINHVKEQFKKEYKDSSDEAPDEHFIYKKITQDIRINVEYSILILLLKIANENYTFEQKGIHLHNPEKVKNDYYTDKIFISLLQNSAYGSVRELTADFEDRMKFLLDSENVGERMEAINCIVENNKNRKIEQLQNIISILGLVITIVFGLPAINDTLSLIRELCAFIENDIPYLTIDNCSFSIWLTFSIGLPLFLWFKSKFRK